MFGGKAKFVSDFAPRQKSYSFYFGKNGCEIGIDLYCKLLLTYRPRPPRHMEDKNSLCCMHLSLAWISFRPVCLLRLFLFLSLSYQFYSFYIVSFAAEKVIKINKNLIRKKRGECVTFQAEHYFPLKASSTFLWKRSLTTRVVENDRISISEDRRNLTFRQLNVADTALYSSEVQTTGGLEVTKYWLVVQGQ